MHDIFLLYPSSFSLLLFPKAFDIRACTFMLNQLANVPVLFTKIPAWPTGAGIFKHKSLSCRIAKKSWLPKAGIKHCLSKNKREIIVKKSQPVIGWKIFVFHTPLLSFVMYNPYLCLKYLTCFQRDSLCLNINGALCRSKRCCLFKKKIQKINKNTPCIVLILCQQIYRSSQFLLKVRHALRIANYAAHFFRGLVISMKCKCQVLLYRQFAALEKEQTQFANAAVEIRGDFHYVQQCVILSLSGGVGGPFSLGGSSFLIV